jgi:NAD(P)-dependent dehydrogenase (short-subunit alcohol dehydrogenase family)
MTLFDLDGKTAIVTGSSRGIGKAIALRLAEHGAHVVISSRKEQACNATAVEINSKIGRDAAIAVPANISSKSDLAALVAETRKKFGRVDTLVCNAASNPYYGPLSGISDDLFRKTLDNNILSYQWLIQMVAPELIDRRSGSIIVVSSIGGMIGTRVIGAYNISKAADLQLVRNLALEFGPHNVRVNSIAPGLIKTDFAKALWEDQERLRQVHEKLPMRRIGDPDEVAGAAVFLASDASAYVTGQSIIVDGGAMISSSVAD